MKSRLYLKAMSVNKLTRISLLGCMQFVAFSMFSDVLYLEMITLTTVLFALVFDKDEAILASIVFVVLNMLIKQGITTWSMMYCLIYPSYSLLVSCMRNVLLKHQFITIIMTGILSFATGQLMQIPFMLVSKSLTILYVLAGLKTSFIQGFVSAIACGMLYYPIYRVLSTIRRSYENEKINKIHA